MAAKRNSCGVLGDNSNRAWHLLRLTLLWARNVKVKLKGLGVGNKPKPPAAPTHHTPYFQRQLSFDRTPDFHLNKDRLRSSMAFLFPCVASKAVEFDYRNPVGAEPNNSYLTDNDEEEDNDDECGCNGCEKTSRAEEEGIDSRAEKFIAEFYGEIRGLRVD